MNKEKEYREIALKILDWFTAGTKGRDTEKKEWMDKIEDIDNAKLNT